MVLIDVLPEPPVCRFVEDNSTILLLIVSLVVLAACGFIIYKYKKNH